jgi:hypothetical protein
MLLKNNSGSDKHFEMLRFRCLGHVSDSPLTTRISDYRQRTRRRPWRRLEVGFQSSTLFEVFQLELLQLSLTFEKKPLFSYHGKLKIKSTRAYQSKDWLEQVAASHIYFEASDRYWLDGTERSQWRD